MPMKIAMPELPVSLCGLEGVPHRVSVVQDRPEALFLLVSGHDLGLDITGYRDDVLQRLARHFQDVFPMRLEIVKETRVPDDSVFEDLREPGNEIRFGQ